MAELSRWEQYKEKHGSTPLDLLNPANYTVSDELRESRYSTCKSCDEYFAPTHQCKKCGCFMNMKTKLEASKCPIGKW
jgi:ribosomal protein L32